MPAIVGYFDPEKQLREDALSVMLQSIPAHDTQIRDVTSTAWAGLGIINYPGRDGILEKECAHKYAVLGDLEALGNTVQPHAAIAAECIGGVMGPQNLKEIRGGFVAAMLDESDRSVTLVSDRFGNYPLYLMRYRDAWIFSSQVKAILSVLPVSARLDQVSVATMLSIGEVVGNRTLVDGVETLPAATVMTLTLAGVEACKYWQYVYEENPDTDWDAAIERVGLALRQSVHRALGHFHDVAIPLSGGLDSRFILDLACNAQVSPAAYTWGTPGCRDIRYAQEVAQRLHCRHEVYHFQPDYLSQVGERGVWLSEGHTPATNFHVLPYVDELACRGHDLILDGFAGDGVLGGNFINSAWFDNPDLASAAEAIWQWRRRGFDGAWATDGLADIHAVAGETFRNLYLTYPGRGSMDKAMAFLIDNRVRRITTCGTELFRSRMLVKQPFMDADVTEAIRTLPHHWRKRHRFYLEVLKRFAPTSAAAPYQRTMLPASAPYWQNLLSMAWQRGYGVLDSKAGFPAIFKGKSPSDFSSWFRQELKPYVEDILLSERALSRGVVPADIARNVVTSHMAGEREFTSLIGAMLSIELFCRLYLDDMPTAIANYSGTR